jgi:hypothetical protein
MQIRFLAQAIISIPRSFSMAKRGLSSWGTTLYWPKRNFHQAWPKQNFASKEHIYSTQRSPGKREVVSTRQSGNGIKGKGKGGHVTDHVIKEHSREDRSWLVWDSWARRGGSKDPKLIKRKRRFRIALSLSPSDAHGVQSDIKVSTDIFSRLHL